MMQQLRPLLRLYSTLNKSSIILVEISPQLQLELPLHDMTHWHTRTRIAHTNFEQHVVFQKKKKLSFYE